MIVLNKKYSATLEAIRVIHEDLRVYLSRFNYDSIAQDPFMLSTSEIFTNAVRHSNKLPTYFHVNLSIQNNSLFLTLMDDGSEFNDFEQMYGTSKKRCEGIKEGDLGTGGIGLYLSHGKFNSFTYEHIDGRNCFRLSTYSPLSPQKPLVLLIDDDPIQRDLISLYLSDIYDVSLAKSGAEAKVWLEKSDREPDLILCDVIMDDGNGVDFCMSLQKNKDLTLIPFIFMTGKPRDKVSTIAETLPVNDFLQKPFNKKILLTILKRTLDKARQNHKALGDKLDDDMTSALAPSLPSVIGSYNIALKWKAAEAGGGDVALHLPGHECDHIVLMDIMGHGAQAKFFSYSFIGYLHGFLSAQKNVQDPADILTALSEFLFIDKIGDQTILTAQILTLLKDGSIKIASAGHPSPLLCDHSGVHKLKIGGSMPGLSSDTVYKSTSIKLKRKQRIILYTDGLMEVGNNTEEMNKHEYDVLKTIKSTILSSIADSADKLWDGFENKVIGAPQDDALFIIIQRD